MNRAPFQVLIIPFRMIKYNYIEYAIFKRQDSKIWQWIAGGGEINETPINAAKRESYEEAKISKRSKYINLDTISSIPKNIFKENKTWKSIYVIPEYSFAVECNGEIIISNEHKKYKWTNYENAYKILKYDSNRTALWELNQKIIKKAV